MATTRLTHDFRLARTGSTIDWPYMSFHSVFVWYASVCVGAERGHKPRAQQHHPRRGGIGVTAASIRSVFDAINKRIENFKCDGSILIQMFLLEVGYGTLFVVCLILPNTVSSKPQKRKIIGTLGWDRTAHENDVPQNFVG